MNRKIKLSILGTLIATSALAITLPIVSCSKSNSEDIELTIENSVIENVENNITILLKSKMNNAATYENQRELANKWSIGSEIPTDSLNSIKDILKFKNGDNDVTYDKSVESITFDTQTSIGNFGSNIEGPILKVNFKNGYIGNVKFKVGSLGNVGAMGLTVDNNVMKIVEDNITLSLKSKMDNAATYEEQKSLANEWVIGSEIPTDSLNSIKDILYFKNGNNEISYSHVVENITFDSNTIIGNLGSSITGPKLKINFKNGYTGNILIQVGYLGDVLTSKLLTPNQESLNTVISDVNINISNEMKMDLKSRDEQIYYSNIVYQVNFEYSNINSNLIKIFLNKLNFTNAQGNLVMGNEAFQKIIVTEKIIIPNTGEPIKGPTFRVVLKNGYYLNEDIIIESGIIGTAA